MGLILDLSGEVCPVPLVKSRRAMDKMERAEILEIIVIDEDLKGNITMAAKELGMDIKRIANDNCGKWHVTIRKTKTGFSSHSKNIQKSSL